VIDHERSTSGSSEPEAPQPPAAPHPLVAPGRLATPNGGSANASARSTASLPNTNGGSATGRAGATVWLTGLPAAGKTTLAAALDRELTARGRPACVLDGDALRDGLSHDLGFSAADRAEQSRRVAHVASLIAKANLVAIVALVSPYLVDRRRAREIHDELGLPFIEVWVDTPLAICERRDPKTLYARGRAGTLGGVTGLDAP
jgi:bifunctional enzyme CysN/CysC